MGNMTGEVIKMTAEQIELLKTYQKRRDEISGLISLQAVRLEICNTELWRAVRNLWPELADYDLNLEWLEKQIRVRHLLTERDKLALKEIEK